MDERRALATVSEPPETRVNETKWEMHDHRLVAAIVLQV